MCLVTGVIITERVDDTGASTLDRAIGSGSQRQASLNRYQSVIGSWTRIRGSSMVNVASASFSVFRNEITPVVTGPQLTFPSIQDGTSFRVPQGTDQQRFQLSDSATFVRGATRCAPAANGSASTPPSTSASSARGGSSSSKTSPRSTTTATAGSTMTICSSP